MQKDSIKREQSQAGLSFAERKNFRPQVKNKLLLLLVLLMTAATGAWGMQIYISYPSWPTGTNVNGDGNLVLEMEASDSFENMKAKIEDKSGLNPDYMKLYFNSVEMANNETLNAKGVTSNSVLTLVYTLYTVSVKDGVKDADKWTITPNPAEEGQTVTLQYNGRLKVKGVKATSDEAPAKTPATVTTAPTGAAVVGVGKTTELVSGGVADGGTLMYAVTTTNTKPTSTAGFSDAVPTAKDITASGTVYVWYYVKADDSHSDSEIAATAIEVPVADIVWDVTNVSSDFEVWGTDQSYTKEGVTLSGNSDDVQALYHNYGDPEMDGIWFEAFGSGGFTFTAPTGKAFTKIEMKAKNIAGWLDAHLLEQLGTGWAFNNPIVTWKGTAAASTVGLLTDADMFAGEPIIYIVFYLSE